MKQWLSAMCLTAATTGCATDSLDVADEQEDIIEKLPKQFSYDIAPGATRDIVLGSFEAGTSLVASNCTLPVRAGTPVATIAMQQHGKTVSGAVTACTGMASSGSYATFESRTGLESWTVHLSCASAVAHCTGTLEWNATHDFNGDLVNVAADYYAIPTTSEDASLLMIDDTAGIFTDPYYGCTTHEDHPEGVVRLANNRFAITADFGDNGKLYLADIASKPIDNTDRLGTNLVNGTTGNTTDRIIGSNFNIGFGRGHLGGAAKSGKYLLTASEQDNSDPTSGLISVIDTTNDALTDVNHYTNLAVLGTDDGAAWVTSAKLGTGSTDKSAANYIPPVLAHTHMIVSTGTNMGTMNVTFVPRNANGVSSLLAPVSPYAVKLPGLITGDNQASLLTQTDGQVFLMTLDGDASSGLDNSRIGTSKLYKVTFDCTNGARVCFVLQAEKSFQTANYVDMKRAAGTYVVATGNAATETIMAYGLWATKVDDRHDSGCGDGHAGPFLRMMEF